MDLSTLGIFKTAVAAMFSKFVPIKTTIAPQVGGACAWVLPGHRTAYSGISLGKQMLVQGACVYSRQPCMWQPHLGRRCTAGCALAPSRAMASL